MNEMRSLTKGANRIDLFKADISTPAQVWDIAKLEKNLTTMSRFASRHGCTFLYSCKASSVSSVMEHMVGKVDGFSCSSLFESKLARQIIGENGSVHMTSPGIRADEVCELAELCDGLTLNSLSQWDRFNEQITTKTSCGIRLNPGVSIVSDWRFDPSRSGSKLGVSLDNLAARFEEDPNSLSGLKGLHFHIACGRKSFSKFDDIVNMIEQHLGGLLHQIEWFNFGGGFYFDKISKIEPFRKSVERLKGKYGLEVVIEPGTSVVVNAARLVCTVIDLFSSGGKTIAVLDTTVNHMQEVFSYQLRPSVAGATINGPNRVVLAGSTCLAGDIFGVYGFAAPVEVGDRIIFNKRGAYTHAQSHWFNGINLPTIYLVSDNGEITLHQDFSYEDFARHCGATPEQAGY